MSDTISLGEVGEMLGVLPAALKQRFPQLVVAGFPHVHEESTLGRVCFGREQFDAWVSLMRTVNLPSTVKHSGVIRLTIDECRSVRLPEAA